MCYRSHDSCTIVLYYVNYILRYVFYIKTYYSRLIRCLLWLLDIHNAFSQSTTLVDGTHSYCLAWVACWQSISWRAPVTKSTFWTRPTSWRIRLISYFLDMQYKNCFCYPFTTGGYVALCARVFVHYMRMRV